MVHLSMNQIEFGSEVETSQNKQMRKKNVCNVLCLVELWPSLICSSKSVMERNTVLMGEVGVWTSARHVIFSFSFCALLLPFLCHIRRSFFSACN